MDFRRTVRAVPVFQRLLAQKAEARRWQRGTRDIRGACWLLPLPGREGRRENSPKDSRIEPPNGARSIAPRDDVGAAGGAMLRAPVRGEGER